MLWGRLKHVKNSGVFLLKRGWRRCLLTWVILDVTEEEAGYEGGLQGSNLVAEMHVIDEDTISQSPRESFKIDYRDLFRLEEIVCDSVVLLLVGCKSMKFHAGPIVDRIDDRRNTDPDQPGSNLARHRVDSLEVLQVIIRVDLVIEISI